MEALFERLDYRIDGYAYQSRQRDRKLDERIRLVEQATLELATALREAGVTVGEVGSPFGPAEAPAPPSADVS